MDFADVTVNFSSIFTLAVIVVTALITLIPIRKAIKLSNKS